MKRLIQSKRINLVAVITTLAALAAHPAVSGLAPESWAPYLAALVAIGSVLGGAGPGVHGVPARGRDIRDDEDEDEDDTPPPSAPGRPTHNAGSHPAVPPRRGRDILRRMTALTIWTAAGCAGAQHPAETTSLEVTRIWVDGELAVSGVAEYQGDAIWSDDTDLQAEGSLDTGAELRLCLDDGADGSACGVVVVSTIIEADDTGTVLTACYWASEAVRGCTSRAVGE